MKQQMQAQIVKISAAQIPDFNHFFFLIFVAMPLSHSQRQQALGVDSAEMNAANQEYKKFRNNTTGTIFEEDVGAL